MTASLLKIERKISIFLTLTDSKPLKIDSKAQTIHPYTFTPIHCERQLAHKDRECEKLLTQYSFLPVDENETYFIVYHRIGRVMPAH